MKNIYSTIFIFMMSIAVSFANPFEVKLVINNGTNTLTVQMRNTTSDQPTTSQNITSINMRLLGQVSDIISIASTNYTMQMPSTIEPNTQVINMSSTALLSPENWIQNQWVVVAVYNLTPGTYTAASFSIQADLDGDNSDVQDPIMSVAAAGVFNTPLTISGTVLPVSLTNFSVRNDNGNAILSWTTYSEVNNEGFEIEKSSDVHGFNRIGWVDGHGNSNQPVNYTFTDYGIDVGMNYFRLKQVDYNGDYKYSEIKSLRGIAGRKEFTIYPNPSNGNLFYVEGTNQKAFTIEIYSTTGRKIFSQKGLSSEIDCSRLENGLYMVRINQDTDTKVFSWIKN